MKGWTQNLLTAARSGDIKAFESLIEPYEKKVYGFFKGARISEKEACILAQEVFLNVFRSLDSVGSPEDMPAVIFKSTRDVYRQSHLMVECYPII